MTLCSCGKEVALRVIRVSVNRHRGVAHWIEHTDGSKICIAGDWTCSMLKPYPKIENERPSRVLMRQWDAHFAEGLK